MSGEVFVPGTTAVVGGRECRFERKRITVLPDSAHCEPQCRLEPDLAAMAAMGGCIVRLVCDRKPDKADPVLVLDDTETCTPFSTAYSNRNGREECIYRYRIDVDNSGKHILTPQLSFGGKPFEVPSYVVWLKGEAGPEGTEPATPGRRRIVYAFAGVLLFLWTAIFVRDHAPAAGRNAVVSRFSWQVYFVVAAALLFIGFCGLLICGALRAEGASRLPVYGVTLLMLFCVCWLVFGELRRSAVRLRIDGDTLAVTSFAGLGFTRRYDLKSFDAITSTILVSRGGAYEYRYLMKAGRRVVRVSAFYLKNYDGLCEALSEHCVYKGRRPDELPARNEGDFPLSGLAPRETPAHPTGTRIRKSRDLFEKVRLSRLPSRVRTRRRFSNIRRIRSRNALRACCPSRSARSASPTMFLRISSSDSSVMSARWMR